MIREGSSNYYPTYDGRGNLTGLLDSGGQYVATYEYDAHGNVVQSWDDPLSAGFTPFRFSTKYTDDGARQRGDGAALRRALASARVEELGALRVATKQTGLVYFGHRYYSPKLGRFVNRDPIGEAGGENLHAYTRNDPVNSLDYLGLATLESGSLVQRNITVRYEVTYPRLIPLWHPDSMSVTWIVDFITEKRERNYVFWHRQVTGTRTVSDPGANQSPSLDMEPAPGDDVLREARGSEYQDEARSNYEASETSIWDKAKAKGKVTTLDSRLSTGDPAIDGYLEPVPETAIFWAGELSDCK